MRWTTLLPADLVAATPADLPTEDSEPRVPVRYDVPLPRDPAGFPLDQLVLCVRLHAGQPLAGHTAATIRAWPAALRRRIALRLLGDIAADPAAGPDHALVFAFERLADARIAWSRNDLAWALRVADGCPELDGGGQILPALIAGTFDAARLAGFGPALRAVFDSVFAERDMNQYAHAVLTQLLGAAIGRADGILGYHLLNVRDGFGVAARRRLDAHGVTAGAATRVALFARTLLRPIPSKSWLRAGLALPPGAVPEIVLRALGDDCGPVNDDNDQQARGLVWLLPPGDEGTLLLADAAFAAAGPGALRPLGGLCAARGGSPASRGGASAARGRRRRGEGPRAPRAAAAAVEALAVRPGKAAAHALAQLVREAGDESLLGRAELAADRQAELL